MKNAVRIPRRIRSIFPFPAAMAGPPPLAAGKPDLLQPDDPLRPIDRRRILSDRRLRMLPFQIGIQPRTRRRSCGFSENNRSCYGKFREISSVLVWLGFLLEGERIGTKPIYRFFGFFGLFGFQVL